MNFGCSNPLEVRPLLLRSVADAADLAALVGLDSNDPLIGSRWKDSCAGGTLMVVFVLDDDPLRSRGCGGAVRTG